MLRCDTSGLARLAREATQFLPFNRGSHPGEIKCGAGNPQHPSGYRTGYFWEEVLQFDSFLDILGSFMFLEKKEEKGEDGKGGHRIVVKEKMVFPRYHQLDAVRNLVGTARREGPGHNYLIQHSAGSGKTNSISWLSHRLASLHTKADEKVFDCVVVITDRQVLDQQLQDAIYQIEHAQGVVKAIDEDSKQLAAALVDGTKIVVTTLQKFPFVLRGLLRVAGADNTDAPDPEAKAQAKAWEAEIARRKYAVIVDEAHSSQSGETARELKMILGAAAQNGNGEEESDWEDRLNQVMQSRGRQPNLSFFAFTATPKGKTLELFGRKVSKDTPEPFHIYSMRQAIEEKFILDVVRNYTTYATYFRLMKSLADDPRLPKKKAARALAKFVTLHPIIYRAFRPYYDATSLQENSDPARLEALKHELDQMQVYYQSEVEAFARVFYQTPSRQSSADHAHLQKHLQPAVDRYKALPEEHKRDEFRDKLSAYVKCYAFLSQIMIYGDADLEMLYSFGRFLLPHLPLDRDDTRVQFGDDVALQYYRLQRISSGPIEVKEGEPEGVRSPLDVGTGKAKDERVPLSEIIEVLNSRFGTNFTEEDRLFFQQISERASRTPQVIQLRQANPFDKFQLGLRKLIEELMVQRMSENDKIVTRYIVSGRLKPAS